MNSVLPAVLFFAWLTLIAGPLGERHYLGNFHPESRHHNTGIPANRAGSQSRFLLRLTKVPGSLQSEPSQAHVIWPLFLQPDFTPSS